MFGIDTKAINEAMDDFRVRLKNIEDAQKEILQRLRLFLLSNQS